MRHNFPALSVIIPVWNEELENLKELYSRLRHVLSGLHLTYEIIFVDNASKNEVFCVLYDLHKVDANVKLIRLVRNFGQAAAFLAGFEYASGEVIATMDSDLQNCPEDLPGLIQKINAGYNAALGWRVRRADPFLARAVPSYFMNKMMTIKTGVQLHDWWCPLNVFRKEVVGKLKDYGQRARFIKPILMSIPTATTKSVIEIPVRHCPRKRGKSRYSVLKLVFTALDFLIYYSLERGDDYDSLFIVKEVYGIKL